jgi:hypothetical protein
MPFSLSCAVARISVATFCSWKGSDSGFRQRIEEAIASGVERRLEKIEAASEAGDWRASAWLLEHCQPQHFARNRVEVTGADGAPLTAGVSLYLPKKGAIVEASEPGDGQRVLTQGNGDADPG